MRTRRVLVATFGSAGDLFPLLPIIEQLRRDGHDVRCASPRSLGLYLRSQGIPTIATGDGSEMRVFDDEHLYTTRFDGWGSWHQTVDRYIATTLRRDTSALRAHFLDWKPDVIAVSGFATASRIAGHASSIPVVELSIYPQHQRMATEGAHFSSRYLREVKAVAGAALLRSFSVAKLAWGAPSEVLLHDRALLPFNRSALQPVGFPYWDNSPARADDEACLRQWLVSSARPRLLVTLGSFVGAARRQSWVDVAEAVERLGVGAAFVGARGRWAHEQFAGRRDLLCVGYVPLSQYLPEFDAVVHHGGLGTTFGSILAGRPAVVLPQAFDQPFNARLVAAAGVGLDGSVGSLERLLEQVMRTRTLTEQTVRVAGELRRTADAVTATTEVILGAADG